MSSAPTSSAPINFDHIAAMSDRFGTFEHAERRTPRAEHGYCVDDVARVLLVAARERERNSMVTQLMESSCRFVMEAQNESGEIRNRRSADGTWHGPMTVDDCWGRSLWGLGTAAAMADSALAEQALTSFDRGARLRSTWSRSMAFAALGAAEVVRAHPNHQGAMELLHDAASVIDAPSDDSGWMWPEHRLTYANAAVPDALMAAGHALGRPALVERGLALLGWLLGRETLHGHLSVTPAGGAGPRDGGTVDDGAVFDQQPIEVAAMADACSRAVDLTGWSSWRSGIEMAGAWFDGDNDSMCVMWDAESGGGFDGLERGGRNENQGAESTLALISTRQVLRRYAPARV